MYKSLLVNVKMSTAATVSHFSFFSNICNISSESNNYVNPCKNNGAAFAQICLCNNSFKSIALNETCFMWETVLSNNQHWTDKELSSSFP